MGPSLSPSRCEEAPRRMIEQAVPDLQPEKRMSLSSPTMISSISLHSPSVTSSGLSKVDAISPLSSHAFTHSFIHSPYHIASQRVDVPAYPVTAARRSMPSKSACSMDTTPASVKICSGKL